MLKRIELLIYIMKINNIEKEFIDDFNKMKADSDKERER